MTTTDDVVAVLEEFADLLEAKDVEFKPRAYRRAAERIEDHPQPIETIAEGGMEELTALEGVGDAIAEKILEYLETGTIEELEELREALPVDMGGLTRVEGLGPKRVGALYEALGIQSLDDLERAAEAGEIQAVEGFGETTEQNILERIPFARQAAERHLLSEVREVADAVLSAIDDHEAVEQVEVAGSIRRWRPTIGDLDILIGTTAATSFVDDLEGFSFVDTIMQAGSRKASIRTDAGIQTDFRFVDPSTFGAALQYFTGSKDHNVQLRQRAIDRGLTINEYGVFDAETEDRLAGDTEESVYEAVDIAWMVPELREARGEIEAAAEGSLPTVIEEDDIRGDLHVHTSWSDGAATIEEMVTAAADAGHDYVAITDHAAGPGVVGSIGLDDDALLEQAEAVEAVRNEADIDVFHGVEANIDTDGDISVGESVREALDIVIASPHAALRQDRTDATERLCRAISAPHVDIIGHPSGRKLGQRSGLDLDIERVASTAADHEVALEVNSHPVRLDLDGEAVQLSIEAGASIAISTDAHHPAELSLMRYGVHTARRGWASAGDVISTLSASELRDRIG